jgi:hypothetical protein
MIKSLFLLVFFNKFHRRTNLIAVLLLRILKFSVSRVPPIRVPTQNGKMKVLFDKFNRKTNLKALSFCNLGSRNKTTHSEFIKLEILRVLTHMHSLKFEGPLRIVCNMWKIFTSPTYASDFLAIKSHKMWKSQNQYFPHISNEASKKRLKKSDALVGRVNTFIILHSK